ncbi:MAG: DUF6133 family protein [Oscillospiraceae bacterium]|nr:DUF6133 family protein [Oscillospiraceae bacterium]
MRNFFKNAKAKIIGAVTFVKTTVCRKFQKTRAAAYRFAVRSNTMLAANRAENFVDSGIKILIAVVIGALLLGGLYALFGDTIMPTVTQKVRDMFNFKG